jgi:hypothetical protein
MDSYRIILWVYTHNIIVKEANMKQIFVRERVAVGEGDAEPRFAVVCVDGDDGKLKFYKTHLRKTELEGIAEKTGSELIFLPRGEGENKPRGGAGSRRRSPRRRDIAGE